MTSQQQPDPIPEQVVELNKRDAGAGAQDQQTQAEQEKQANQAGAFLAGVTGARILQREAQADRANAGRQAQAARDDEGTSPDGPDADADTDPVTWAPEPGLGAKVFAWVLLLGFGLGSLALLVMFLVGMAGG